MIYVSVFSAHDTSDFKSSFIILNNFIWIILNNVFNKNWIYFSLQEANLIIEQKQKEPFFELNRILEECKNHNLEPALR